MQKGSAEGTLEHKTPPLTGYLIPGKNKNPLFGYIFINTINAAIINMPPRANRSSAQLI